jgi:hypothetical protein
MNRVPLVYRYALFIVPGGQNDSPQPTTDTPRRKVLEMARDGKLHGEFRGHIFDVAPLQITAKPPQGESVPVPEEVLHWLAETYGKAVLIQSLEPRPLLPGWEHAKTSPE